MDRKTIGLAALRMNRDLHFTSIYGFREIREHD
jgi:hypothetical protein